MTAWRDLAERGCYGSIAWWHLSEEDQREYLDHLRLAVPRVIDRDGMEARERFAHPDEVDDAELKMAALDLLLGELAMAVEGDPADEDPSIAEWRELRAEVEGILSAQIKRSDRSARRPFDELTVEAHAERGLERLEALSVLFAHYLSESEADGGAEGRAFMDAALSECALVAFSLGASVRATWSKSFEPQAVVRIRQEQASAPALATMNAERRNAALAWHAEAGRLAAAIVERRPDLSDSAVAQIIHEDFAKRCRRLDALLVAKADPTTFEEDAVERRRPYAASSPFLTALGNAPDPRTIRGVIRRSLRQG